MSLEHPTESEDRFTNSNEPEIALVKTNGVPLWFKPVALVTVLATVTIYVLRLDKVVGMTVDDAWYVLLAKGLATGQGYTVANSPSPGILPLYPPGFPFLLSLLYRLAPRFPENVTLLKSVSVLSMLGAGWLTYIYFTKTRSLTQPYALLLALSVMLCPPLVFLATSTLMSECFFTLLILAALVAAERVVAAQRAGSALAWGAVILCAVLSAYAFLTRSIAITLVGAIFLYFIKERCGRSIIFYTAIVTILILPWMAYSRVNTPTYEQIREQGGQIVMSYGTQFWQRIAAMTGSDTITVAEVPARVANNLWEIAGRDMLRVAAAPLFEKLRDPYKDAQRLFAKEAEGKQGDKTEGVIWLSLLLSLFVIIGYVGAWRERFTSVELCVPLMILLIALWPWETIRFVLPLTPFLLFYLLKGFQIVTNLISQRTGAAVTLAKLPALLLLVFFAINLYGHISYIAKIRSGDKPQWMKTFAAVESMLIWTKQNVPSGENIVALNPALVHLYTGHKTIAWEDPKVRWYVMRKLGIRYFVRFAAYPIPEESELANYQISMQAPDAWGKVIDLGPEATRILWGATAPDHQ